MCVHTNRKVFTFSVTATVTVNTLFHAAKIYSLVAVKELHLYIYSNIHKLHTVLTIICVKYEMSPLYISQTCICYRSKFFNQG